MRAILYPYKVRRQIEAERDHYRDAVARVREFAEQAFAEADDDVFISARYVLDLIESSSAASGGSGPVDRATENELRERSDAALTEPARSADKAPTDRKDRSSDG